MTGGFTGASYAVTGPTEISAELTLPGGSTGSLGINGMGRLTTSALFTLVGGTSAGRAAACADP